MEERSLIRMVCAAAAGILLAGAVRESAAGLLFPLAGAWLGARAARPSAEWLSRRCRRIPEKLVRAAYAVFLCAALLYLLAALSGKIAGELLSLAERLPEAAEETAARLTEWCGRLPPSVRGMFLREEEAPEVVSLLRKAASSAASFLAPAAASAVQKVPGGLISVFVTAAGFVYLTADPKGAGDSLLSLLPEKAAERAVRLYRTAADAVFACVRAYALLTLLTFAELCAGLVLLRVPDALAAAGIAALADALPVLGCGIVLTPWACRLFLAGEYGRAAGMLALTGAVWLIRQFAEPRIVGRAAGLSPFAALACLFAGWKLGGAAGLILAPVIAGAAAGIRSSGGASDG